MAQSPPPLAQARLADNMRLQKNNSQGGFSVKRSNFSVVVAIAFGIALSVTCGFVQTGAQAKTVKSPDWFLQGSAPPDDLARADAITRAADPRDPLTACAGDIPKLCPDLPRPGQRS